MRLLALLVFVVGCGGVRTAPSFQECAAALDDPCRDPAWTVHVCAGTGPAFIALCEIRATRGRTLKSFETTGQSDACPDNPTRFACCGALTAELRAFCRRAIDEPVLVTVPDNNLIDKKEGCE